MTNGHAASGRFLLRLPPPLHAQLAAAARARGISLNEHCVRSLGRAEAGGDGLFSEAIALALTQLGPALVGAAVFGSWARGEAGPESDIDLLLVAGEAVKVERALYAPWDSIDLRVDGHAVEPHFVRLPAPGEAVSGLWAEVALDGAVVHDPTFALSRTLGTIRRRILAGDLVRRTAGGQSWWTAA
jgi:hypothetical protein